MNTFLNHTHLLTFHALQYYGKVGLHFLRLRTFDIDSNSGYTSSPPTSSFRCSEGNCGSGVTATQDMQGGEKNKPVVQI